MKCRSNRRRMVRGPKRMGALVLVALLWPSVAESQRADGATRSLEILPDWPEHEPWCALDAMALANCAGVDVTCGAVTVPCEQPIGGLRMVAAGVGLRNSGSGTIEVRGAPDNSQLVASWLIWGLITRDPSDPVTRMASLNGVSITGQVFGETDEPCWETSALENTRFVALWADVTDLMGGKVNSDFAIWVRGSAQTDGSDPWGGPPGQTPPLAGGSLVDGASLISIYSHPSVAPEAMVVLHASTDLLIDAANYKLVVPSLPPATRVQHLRVGGDGQTQNREEALAPFKTTLTFGSGPSVVIRGATSTIDAHADWQGGDGGPITQLWDTQLTSASASVVNLQPGFREYQVTYEPDVASGLPFDCVAVVLHGLSVYSPAE